MIHGSKRQRPNGRWQFTAELGRNPDGSRAQAHATVGGTGRYDKLTEREAERELHKWLATLKSKGKTAPDKTVAEYLDRWVGGQQALRAMTVAEYLDLWVEEQRTLRAINTARASAHVAEQWFKPNFGGVRMQELRPGHCQAMLNKMKEHGLAA